MNVIQKPSPNFDSRGGVPIDMLVLHYTGMRTASEALERLCDPNAKVSAHYVVDEDGTIYSLVGEERRAWHAGLSKWRGQDNINQRSIGIEIVNPGHEFGYRPFPAVQMKAVATLARDILARNKTIPPRNVVAHSDVAPTRKEDPGELFDWQWLAEQGVGLWPQDGRIDISKWRAVYIIIWLLIALRLSWALSWCGPISVSKSLSPDHIAVRPLPPYADIQAQLSQYGYDCPQTGVMDDTTRKVILAFQRHFSPKRLTGLWDRECALRLASLLALS